MRLRIIALFFCCALMQASSVNETAQETVFSMQVRARMQREKSKKFYAKQKDIKQIALWKKLKSDFSVEDKNIPLVFAKPIADDNLKDF